MQVGWNHRYHCKAWAFGRKGQTEWTCQGRTGNRDAYLVFSGVGQIWGTYSVSAWKPLLPPPYVGMPVSKKKVDLGFRIFCPLIWVHLLLLCSAAPGMKHTTLDLESRTLALNLSFAPLTPCCGPKLMTTIMSAFLFVKNSQYTAYLASCWGDK